MNVTSRPRGRTTRGTKGLGMVRARGNLCRTRKGKFTRCRKPIKKGSGKGFAKRHADIARKRRKGRCLKWSKTSPKRCVRRKVRHYNPGKGRCLKWSKGRTRCVSRGG
jgi:hypothetical protein